MLTIRNQTAYPDDEVDRLVRWAVAQFDVKETLVVVSYTRNNSPYSGMAYNSLPYDMKPWPKSAWYGMKLRIGRPHVYPYPDPCWRHGGLWNYKPDSEWPLWMCETWQETLVMLAAHEAKHIEDYQHKPRNKRRRPELACELAADRVVKQFKKRGVIAVTTVTYNGIAADLLEAVKAIEGVTLLDRGKFTIVKHGKTTLGYVNGKRTIRVDMPMKNKTRTSLHVKTKADVAKVVKEMESFIPTEKPKATPKATAKKAPENGHPVPGTVVLAEREAKPDPKPAKKH